MSSIPYEFFKKRKNYGQIAGYVPDVDDYNKEVLSPKAVAHSRLQPAHS